MADGDKLQKKFKASMKKVVGQEVIYIDEFLI